MLSKILMHGDSFYPRRFPHQPSSSPSKEGHIGPPQNAHFHNLLTPSDTKDSSCWRSFSDNSENVLYLRSCLFWTKAIASTMHTTMLSGNLSEDSHKCSCPKTFLMLPVTSKSEGGYGARSYMNAYNCLSFVSILIENESALIMLFSSFIRLCNSVWGVDLDFEENAMIYGLVTLALLSAFVFCRVHSPLLFAEMTDRYVNRIPEYLFSVASDSFTSNDLL